MTASLNGSSVLQAVLYKPHYDNTCFYACVETKTQISSVLNSLICVGLTLSETPNKIFVSWRNLHYANIVSHQTTENIIMCNRGPVNIWLLFSTPTSLTIHLFKVISKRFSISFFRLCADDIEMNFRLDLCIYMDNYS